MKNLGGRPTLSDADLKLILHKLAPHLQAGQSMETACFEEKISPSTVFKKMKEYDWFMEEIDRYKNYKKILYGSIRLMQLNKVFEKVKNNETLSKDEYHLLDWLGENDKALADQYGKKPIEEKPSETEKKAEQLQLDDPRVQETLLQLSHIYVKRTKKENVPVGPLTH